jgi:uncharacterized membrane protein YebE (DUF533 family)
MKKIKTILIVILSLFVTTTIIAQNKMPVVKKRQKHQMHRIAQGVKSGELTRKEAKELIQKEKEIQQMKKEAKSDGVVTKEERKEIHKELNQQSKEIYKQKHDAQRRFKR